MSTTTIILLMLLLMLMMLLLILMVVEVMLDTPACHRSGPKQQRDGERGHNGGCGEAGDEEEGRAGEEEGKGRGGRVASRPWTLPCCLSWNKVFSIKSNIL